MNPRHHGPDEQRRVTERTGPISAPAQHTRSGHLVSYSTCAKCAKSANNRAMPIRMMVLALLGTRAVDSAAPVDARRRGLARGNHVSERLGPWLCGSTASAARTASAGGASFTVAD